MADWGVPAPNARIVEGVPTDVRPGRALSLAVHEPPAQAETCVFLCHGAGGNKNQWRNQWRLFAGLGWRVVAWDMPGHGETTASKRAEVYDGAELVADYRALIEQHGATRNILVGHSYGARLTLCILAALKAEGRLDRIERAVLLGAPPPVPTLGVGPIARWPVWLLALMRPMINANFLKLAWDPGADPALVRFEDQQAQANSLFMMKALMTRSAPLAAVDLGGLSLPILLLAGDHDGLTPLAGAQAVADRLPDARLEVIADCGHQIMLEQPVQTNAAILGFAGEPSG
jgi:pimeloyl-ACP methyl ester carboxylesterase